MRLLARSLWWLEHPATHDAYRHDPELYASLNSDCGVLRRIVQVTTRELADELLLCAGAFQTESGVTHGA